MYENTLLKDYDQRLSLLAHYRTVHITSRPLETFASATYFIRTRPSESLIKRLPAWFHLSAKPSALIPPRFSPTLLAVTKITLEIKAPY